MNAIKSLNLLLSFLLELSMLFFYGYWAYHLPEPVVLKYTLAILAPALIAVVWGIWAAPKSKYRLANPGRSVLKLILLLTAAALCFTTVQHGWAGWYTGYTLLNVALAFAFKQDY